MKQTTIAKKYLKLTSHLFRHLLSVLRINKPLGIKTKRNVYAHLD